MGAAAAELAPGLTVNRVSTESDLEAFLHFQLDLYRNERCFVPPIVRERRDFLDKDKNPFFRHAEMELFLARRHGQVVGRIAAVNDVNYNRFHNSDYATFGLFESIDDVDVASGLLNAAKGFARAHGMKALLGPMNLSTNHDCGLLVEGFDSPPAMMMPWNHRYYPALFDAVGLTKLKDLYAYELSTSVAPPEKLVRIAEKAKEQGAVVRPIDLSRIEDERRKVKNIYNDMLDSGDLAFVPMEDDEIDFIAERLRPLIQFRPELCLMAEVKGEPVAFSFTLPDANQLVGAAGGRLTRFGLPVGLIRMAWAYARGIDRLRVLLLGIKPEYKRRGIDALLFLETLRAAQRLGYTSGEIGWTTEDNTSVNRTIEAMGGRRYKTYRLYTVDA